MMEENPYDGRTQSRLRDAWNRGYRAGRKGRPYPNENPYDQNSEEKKAQAWLDGYTAARQTE